MIEIHESSSRVMLMEKRKDRASLETSPLVLHKGQFLYGFYPYIYHHVDLTNIPLQQAHWQLRRSRLKICLRLLT